MNDGNEAPRSEARVDSASALVILGLMMFAAGLWRWFSLGVMLTIVGALLITAGVIIESGRVRAAQEPVKQVEDGGDGADPQ